jgi:hypothetical protein
MWVSLFLNIFYDEKVTISNIPPGGFSQRQAVDTEPLSLKMLKGNVPGGTDT